MLLRLTSSLWLLFICISLTLAQTKIPSGKALLDGLQARQIGPAVMSGRISSLAVVPDQPEIMYIGSAGGGLWKSISGGTSIRPVFDEHNMSIGKVVIDPNQTETIWVGTGEPWVRNSTSVGDGIYRSKDGGNKWEHLGLEDSERIADIIVSPENSDLVYVAVMGHLWDANEQRGVYKTEDGGANWEKILYIDENTGAVDLAMDPQNPAILYASMWDHRRTPWAFDSGFKGQSGLYKTIDGGKNWEKVQTGLPEETP